MHRLFRYWSGSSDAIHDDDESKEDEVEHEHELELEHERDGGCENVDDQVNTENPGGAAGTESADFGVDETVGEGCDVPTNGDESHIKVHVEESEDITMHQDNNSSDAHKFEQINEDLVIPHSIATTSTTNNTTQELPLHSPNKDHQNNHSDLNDEHDDSFPKAKDFLADLLFITEENYADENETIQIPPEQASEIVCGFDQDENYDARTVITQALRGLSCPLPPGDCRRHRFGRCPTERRKMPLMAFIMNMNPYFIYWNEILKSWVIVGGMGEILGTGMSSCGIKTIP